MSFSCASNPGNGDKTILAIFFRVKNFLSRNAQFQQTVTGDFMKLDMELDMKLSRNCAMLDYESYRTICLGLLLCVPMEFKHPSNVFSHSCSQI